MQPGRLCFREMKSGGASMRSHREQQTREKSEVPCVAGPAKRARKQALREGLDRQRPPPKKKKGWRAGFRRGAPTFPFAAPILDDRERGDPV